MTKNERLDNMINNLRTLIEEGEWEGMCHTEGDTNICNTCYKSFGYRRWGCMVAHKSKILRLSRFVYSTKILGAHIEVVFYCKLLIKELEKLRDKG